MGGDHAPSAIVDGALAAARHLDLQISLVGASASIAAALARHPDRRDLPVRIVEAPDVIEMAESAAAARRKPRASIRVAADLVARREADALFSAGHTGATVLATHLAFGMIAAVDRPALATAIPTRERSAVLLDAGANVECRPQHLLQFALMGGVFARLAFGLDRPRVGLLSIGEEASKGNDLTREAHRLLKAAPINFIGNVEGREIYSGVADVIVCDGFTGNVVLKTGEGLVETVEALLGDELASCRAFRRFRRSFDYSEYGGAPLLGVAGLTIVGHGRSSAKAVRNAIAMASRFAAGSFIQRVQEEIAAASVSHP
jgi:glycerol-3-phosphate acyltransferase PlsX